ncbi:hypothetical protein AUQ37_04280 [Candidatus Methanomethylophilus sp. 1R26]|uniref:FprA family A-type flavoprotein n=1 Tax=Candidatus Methanomethylophilus sp. 1R26 TaxID=1769296 RepID=UPI0007367003|nr:FprA family A-type flavoprotein [Candidatus Methanomethylophilus sp. 1R26]KUE73083.1 hypothetical protein AUQ37_04280 [Candidatus Methanomethylophilus sp. 1R26]
MADRWAEELLEALGGRAVDYYVVHHMEPDHSASMKRVLSMFPGARIVASAKALRMMNQFLNADMSAVTDTVKEGDVLDLGGGTQLKFIEAPNVHWPEVIMSYLPAERTLFSVDAWGRFGPGSADYEWMAGARRYYFNIVGKFGAAVLKVLDKASGLDIARICPLHGCPLEEGIGKYVSIYRGWASYEPRMTASPSSAPPSTATRRGPPSMRRKLQGRWAGPPPSSTSWSRTPRTRSKRPSGTRR